MTTVQLSTNKREWLRGYKGGNVVAANTTPVIQTADPIATDGVVRTEDMNLAKIMFGGRMHADATANDKTIEDAEIYGWAQIPAGPNLWVPTLIARVDCTLGNTPNCVGSTDAADTWFGQYFHFADTIQLIDGDESCRIISGIADRMASMTVDLEGATRMQVIFKGAFSGTQVEEANYMYGLL